MPLKHTDPFASSAARLDASVNPYVALLRDGAVNGALPVLFGEGLRGLAGGWRAHIATFHGLTTAPRRLIVEIGCHKGHTLLTMAKAHPDTLFIGIDITYKRVVTTAQRALAAGLKNVYCVMANAVGIDQLFAPGELDGVVIFFPDPWIKKKSQAKNRLVDDGFCRRLHGVLADGGHCWLKTDQRLYFELGATHLDEAGFAGGAAGEAELSGDYTSVFEQRFQEQSLPTYGGKWRRGAGPATVSSQLS